MLDNVFKNERAIYINKRKNVYFHFNCRFYIYLCCKNPIFLTINSNIIGVLLTNSVEKAVFLDLNVLFIYGLTRDNIIEDLKTSYYLFNNLKWFQTIYFFDKLYKVFNVNDIVIYDIGSVINISFRMSGGSLVNFRL